MEHQYLQVPGKKNQLNKQEKPYQTTTIVQPSKHTSMIHFCEEKH